MTGQTNDTPSTTAVEWTPPAGSWEDEIDSISGFDDENGGKLTVYLAWKNGKKTQHPTAVVYGKCPQKMLQWYEKHVVIIRNAGAKLPEEPKCRVPADAHDQAKLQDRVKRHHIDLYLLESNYNSNLEQATSEYEQRTEAVVQRLCDKLIATLGPGRIKHSLRGLEPQRLDEYLLGDYSTSAINGAKGVRPTAILETAAGVAQGQDKDTTAATRRGVKRRGVNTTDSETATKRPAIAENGPRLSRRQRKRKNRNIGGNDQDQQAAPEDVIPGNIYLVWERSKMWSAVLLLPTDAMDSIGVPETMETLGLSANPPDCYVVDTRSKQYKWRKGYEDGGPRVAERIYPVLDFDDLHKRRARWVTANELKAFDEEIAQSLDYYPLIQEYLRRRLVKDRSDDERTIFVRALYSGMNYKHQFTERERICAPLPPEVDDLEGISDEYFGQNMCEKNAPRFIDSCLWRCEASIKWYNRIRLGKLSWKLVESMVLLVGLGAVTDFIDLLFELALLRCIKVPH
ncbi:High-osmolarity-induced transcription protein 1 [Purpureocillium lavendulum]|uniref:High-osmolarity-induced transcription protein 1 n=1 Tax=Purpureocillium lavendulum TaxID=1247861 RepID=A0AB34FCQ9_9HYPO|nr:High-osmolarity-induced transcription protein 1 [Purpureocillium lavendulum]